MQESIALCEQTKNRWGLGTAYRSQGLVEMACGNLGEAQRLFHKSLDTFGDYIMGWNIARTEIYLGEATRLAGDPIGARAILLNALRIAHDIHSAPLMLDAISGLASLDVRQNPEQVADWLTLVMGHPAATRETSERACQLLSAVERHPGVEQIEGSPENVANQSLEALVETILKPKGLHTQTMR